MADLNEVAALLHVHKGLHEHGTVFPNLKQMVWKKLLEIEADHAPKKPVEEQAPAEEASVAEEREGDQTDHEAEETTDE